MSVTILHRTRVWWHSLNLKHPTWTIKWCHTPLWCKYNRSNSDYLLTYLSIFPKSLGIYRMTQWHRLQSVSTKQCHNLMLFVAYRFIINRVRVAVVLPPKDSNMSRSKLCLYYKDNFTDENPLTHSLFLDASIIWLFTLGHIYSQTILRD